MLILNISDSLSLVLPIKSYEPEENFRIFEKHKGMI